MLKKISNAAGIALIPVIASGLMRLIAATMRISYVRFEEYRSALKQGRQHILTFWHGRLMMMPHAYRGGKGITILVSQSRDGELVSRTVRRFGIESVRGSSTRGWLGGIKGILKAAQSGRDLAITPDGPKGPRYEAQMGVIQIARRTGLPIFPLAFGASKKKHLAAGIPL